ncbi:MAG TPA: hypothetical protein VGM05_19130 [Planctomycetaceae bacterium]|jgi:hypothetical protein
MSQSWQPQTTAVHRDARPCQILGSHADLARTLDALEQKYGRQFKIVFDAIYAWMVHPETPKSPRLLNGISGGAK